MSAILISRIIGALVLALLSLPAPIYSYVQQFVEVLSLSQELLPDFPQLFLRVLV